MLCGVTRLPTYDHSAHVWRKKGEGDGSICYCTLQYFLRQRLQYVQELKQPTPPHPSLSFEQGCDGITRRTLIVTSWWCDAGKSYPFSSSHFLRFGVPHKILLYIDRLCLPISFFYHLYYMYHTLHVFSWLCYRTVTPCVAVIVWVCG